MQKEKVNVIEDKNCWRCTDCGAEWSFMLSDDQVPEHCTYCSGENNS